jgi:hypothetical protein
MGIWGIAGTLPQVLAPGGQHRGRNRFRYGYEPANVEAVRTAGTGLLWLPGVIFLLTSGVLSAVAQPVNGPERPPETARPERRGTGPDIQAKKEFESSGAALRHVPCNQVISWVDRDSEFRRGEAPDMSVVAKELDTSVVWVERCMLTYGRRPKRQAVESAESREQRLESLEEDEPEERGPEDIEEEGAPERRENTERSRRFHQAIRLHPAIGRPAPEGED